MADMSTILKNTAFTLSFTLFKNDGTVVANPGTYTKKVSIDGGAVGDIAASVTEEDTTYGQLSLVLAAGEMNGDFIWVYVTDNTAGTVPFIASFYPAAGALASAAALTVIDDFLDTEMAAVYAAVHTDAAGTNIAADIIALKADTTATLEDTGTTLDTVVDAIAAEVTLVHSHVAEWNDGERLDLLLDDAAAGGGGLSEADVRTAVGLATANLDTQLAALPTDAAAVNAACDSAISDAALATAASLATVDAVVDGIIADTNELQTEWANGGRLDLILDAAGGSGSLDAAGVRTAIGMASANLDTQIGALGGGAGAVAWDGYTLTESDGTPIADADVWITTDGAGANVVASGRTDAFGVPRAHSGSLLYLDPGTYSVWADKVGWSFPNPDTVTVVTP